jgi:hypothetical protein
MYIVFILQCKKKSENLSDLDKKDRNKRHSSPFINAVKGVFFVVRVTLVPVSYLLYNYLYIHLHFVNERLVLGQFWMSTD